MLPKSVNLLTTVFAILLVSCTHTRPDLQTEKSPAEYEIPEETVIERLSKAIQFKTISHRDTVDFDPQPFENFLAFIEKNYPNLHTSMERERIGGYSMLYKWEGSNPDLKPGLLMGHYDVVPIEEETEEDWNYTPFGGEVAQDSVWGRGTLDDKSGILSMLEAMEYLLKRGYRPARTMYLAVNHDEEVGGRQGALQIAERMKEQGIYLEFLVDEGLPIAEEIIDGVDVPLAMIGVVEKGNVSIELSLHREGGGGHSSMPPRETVIGTLSKAVNRLEENDMSGRYTGLLEETFEPIIPYLSYWQRLAFNNLWLFRGTVERKLSERPPTNAALRTTTASIIFDSGFKENVLPVNGKVIVNFRIHPGDTVEDVVEHVRQTIRNPEIEIQVLEGAREASFVSDRNARPYRILRRTIRNSFENLLVSPSIFVAASDSRHFHDLTRNIYRFRPIRARQEDRSRVHGIDERISVSNYREMIRFYIRLIENLSVSF